MTTIRNLNDSFGDSTTFTADTLDAAVASMQAAVRNCGPEFAYAVVTADDYEVVQTVRVTVDMEFNADTWWAALEEQYPAIAARLRENDEAELTLEEWQAVRALPGFADGPVYARTALIEISKED